MPEHFAQGEDCFADQGFYAGPLARRSAKRQLVGTHGNRFATTGSEQWPSNMCKWIATTILENFSSLYRPAPAVLAGDGTQDMQGQSEVLQPDGRKLVGAGPK